MFPAVGFKLGFDTLTELEMANVGATLSSMSIPINDYSVLTGVFVYRSFLKPGNKYVTKLEICQLVREQYGVGVLVLYFDYLFFAFLYVYLEQVIPTDYGVPQKPW